jgi:hypothetical protein
MGSIRLDTTADRAGASYIDAELKSKYGSSDASGEENIPVALDDADDFCRYSITNGVRYPWTVY